MENLEEYNAFREFKNNYGYNMNEIEIIEEKEYVDNLPLVDEEGIEVGECEKWINVGYKLPGNMSKLLSNLFEYEFEFRGNKLSSIESFFQGIKFEDINMQNEVFKYSGLSSNRIKSATTYDWKKTGILFWQGKAIDRYSEEYNQLVDEVYIAAIQNPLYRNVLKNCNKQIIHTMGGKEKADTVFTRYEFEKELNCLKEFLKMEK